MGNSAVRWENTKFNITDNIFSYEFPVEFTGMFDDCLMTTSDQDIESEYFKKVIIKEKENGKEKARKRVLQ